MSVLLSCAECADDIGPTEERLCASCGEDLCEYCARPGPSSHDDNTYCPGCADELTYGDPDEDRSDLN